MLDYSKYYSPIKASAIIAASVLVLFLYIKPTYFPYQFRIYEIDWEDPIVYITLFGSITGYFLLFDLIPGLYLSSEYYKSDKLAYQKIKNQSLSSFKNSIRSAECISSYMEGKYMPGAIHSEYWYYKLHLENNRKLKASCFLVEELNLLENLDEEPEHVYAFFPSMKWEDDMVLKDKDFSSVGPSKKLINRFENRYKDYSKDKLQHIKNNNSYRKEAKIAAINLLNME